jgi:hypothetical protein
VIGPHRHEQLTARTASALAISLRSGGSQSALSLALVRHDVAGAPPLRPEHLPALGTSLRRHGGDGNRRHSTRTGQAGLHVVRANSGTSGAMILRTVRRTMRSAAAGLALHWPGPAAEVKRLKPFMDKGTNKSEIKALLDELEQAGIVKHFEEGNKDSPSGYYMGPKFAEHYKPEDDTSVCIEN